MPPGVHYLDVEGPLRAWLRDQCNAELSGRVYFGAGDDVAYPWAKVTMIDAGIARGGPEQRVLLQVDVLAASVEDGGRKSHVVPATYALVNAVENVTTVDLATDDAAWELRLLGGRVVAQRWAPTTTGGPRNVLDVELTCVAVPV